MTRNEEVAQTLEELAAILEARRELIFKIRAYRKAAAAIRELGVPLEEYRRERDLRTIPGVGGAIAKKVSDMLDLGPREWLSGYVSRLDSRT